MVSGCGVTEVSHPPGPSMLRCLMRLTMQSVRRLTQAALIRRSITKPETHSTACLDPVMYFLQAVASSLLHTESSPE